MALQRIEPKDFTRSPFEMIGKEWVLLAAQQGDKANAMTCSWGGLGVLWRKNVAFIFVRHSRHTFGFMETAEAFSLSWFDDPGHKLLGYFGKVSGRDEDKIAVAGLDWESREGAPCFQKARRTILCRKLFSQDMAAEHFHDTSILGDCYSDNDFHRMYVGEILQIEEEQSED